VYDLTNLPATSLRYARERGDSGFQQCGEQNLRFRRYPVAEIVQAIYEKGVLRPLRPLGLRERQVVRIQVQPEEIPPDENAAEAAIRALVAAGRLTPPLGHSQVIPIPDEEYEELADRLGQAPGKTLSEIIIEDRG
jgi:predicted DNA-binding antitoxin AbrB/MazE fold protein